MEDSKNPFTGLPIGFTKIPVPSRRTVNDHYGVSHEQMTKFADDMLIDFIKFGEKPKVLDKHFKELDAEGRAKVIAFCTAMQSYQKIYG